MDKKDESQELISSGVEELIERLRSDGVKAGRSEADAILEQARVEVARLLEEKRAEADRYREEATAAVRAERDAASEALKLASRDTLLYLEKQISQVFAQRLKRAVSEELHAEDLLRALILQAAGRAGADLPAESRAILELPARYAGDDSKLTPAVLGLTHDLLREGVTVEAGEHEEGITLRLAGDDVMIDLSEEALSKLVLRQLIPTFQELLRGHLRP